MQKIISQSDILLVPTVEKEISYIWELLDQWPSGCIWKSMYSGYDEFENDIRQRLKSNLHMIWTCWTKQGKSSKKFGMIMLDDICYGLSAEIHGVVDKEFYKDIKKISKRTYADKAMDAVLKVCFEDLGVARVNGTFYKLDPLLVSLLRRHGFKKNAHLKKSVYINEKIHDTYIFGLLEDQYLKGKENV